MPEKIYSILIEIYNDGEIKVYRQAFKSKDDAYKAAREEFDSIYNRYTRSNRDEDFPINSGETYFEVEDLFSVTIVEQELS